MFQLTSEEAKFLRSQIVTSNERRGGRRYLPFAFTEHGVAMLSSVLNSSRAVQMNILIIRAFVRLRELLITHKDLAERLRKLEAGQKHQASVIALIASEISALTKRLQTELRLLREPRPRKTRIGFHVPEKWLG